MTHHHVDSTMHDAHCNAPVTSFRHLVRKLSSGGASLYDSPRPRLYSNDVEKDEDNSVSNHEHHKRLRQRAKQRRKALLDAQAKANRRVQQHMKKKTICRVVSSLTHSLERLNPSRWKENGSDHDQKVVDQLEREFEDALEQEQYLKLCKEASDACLKAVKDHHDHFLEDHPHGTYEQWIQELHPDNTCSSFEKNTTIDHRFYLSDSDHRTIWNDNLGNGARSHVPARHLIGESRTSSDEDGWSSST